MIHYKILNSINDVSPSWDKLVEHDILLQKPYLKALEEASPANIQLYFLEVFQNNKLVGVSLLQRVQLYLKDIFRNSEVSCFKEFIKENVSKVLKGNMLVVGNLTHTGQHGLYFEKGEISNTEFYEQVFIAISELKKIIKTEEGKRIRAIMLKDFFVDDNTIPETVFKKEKLHKVKVQPNMIMPICDNWSKSQDYIDSLNKKYRTRFRRAKKKLNSIVCKEMNLIEIKTNAKRLYELYLNVSNNAKFNTFILPENHFYLFKAQLQENFKVFGYYLKDELIGFHTLILNKENIETYFLGYDHIHQYPNQLYLNMLYNMAFYGIENDFKSIVYARTAMEIKSSVGAKPQPMVIYLKHTNGFMNAILKQIFKLMNPSQAWIERHPFK